MFRYLFMLCALLSILTTIAIIDHRCSSMRSISLHRFRQSSSLTGTRWSPNEPKPFGVLPLISGTLAVTVGAAAVALPIGLLTAIYLSEYASSADEASSPRSRCWRAS